MTALNLISILGLLLSAIPVGYCLVMALASIRSPRDRPDPERASSSRFAIMIPAHDEENVIAATIRRMKALDYPKDLFDVYVVADHCTDRTANRAREAGAFVFERNVGPRSGKGGALAWLFEQVFGQEQYDAAIIFDADTLVDPAFLRVMDAQLTSGAVVVQGQHIISNPGKGWYPALIWSMFLIDNRFQNLGRMNLGWSAKHMGDSICFRTGVLTDLGWGHGLTEDYEMRQRLLLEGIKIRYEPRAIGLGEAPLTWAQARAQRARWLQGAREASRQHAWRLLVQAARRRDGALLDGALTAYLPAYSTMTMVCLLAFFLQLVINLLVATLFSWTLIWLWLAIAALLFFYPFFGLALERAPRKAYLAIMLGPVFILWRTWLALRVRLTRKPMSWVRTKHGEPG